MKSHTQQLLADIIQKHKCSLSEAWNIYRKKYEDVELDPKIAYNPHKPIYNIKHKTMTDIRPSNLPNVEVGQDSVEINSATPEVEIPVQPEQPATTVTTETTVEKE